MIETTQGPMDESAMVTTQGVIDDAKAFMVYRDFRVPESTETYRRILGGFEKRNPFEAPRGIIGVDLGDGEIQAMDEAALEKTIGHVDDAREFTCWVECRLPGTSRIVHRSADVKLKTTPGHAVAAAGSFG